MAFNHYAKIKRILENYQWEDWYILRINEKTKTKSFNGDINEYDYYYRIFDKKNNQIPYCKFQLMDKLASILDVHISELEIKILE